MKRGLLFTCAIGCCSTFPAFADMLGIKAGVNLWDSSDFGQVTNGYFSFEHFVPLVPNLAIRASRISDKDLEVNTYDAYGYYEILDMDIVSLDIGFGARRLNNGKVIDQKFSDTLPMAMAEISIFNDSTISLYTRLDAGKLDETSFYEWDIGARFNLIAGLGAQAGYRSYSLEFDGFNNILTSKEKIDGPHLGVFFDW